MALLYGRAGHVAEGTEDAAVPRLRVQEGVTRLALVVPLAGIHGHAFRFAVAALRAGEGGVEEGLGHGCDHSTGQDTGAQVCSEGAEPTDSPVCR